jgi:hypothetical protein
MVRGLLLVCVALILVACGDSPPTATPIVITATPGASPTPIVIVVTATPLPVTNTPRPQPTVTPLPTAAAESLITMLIQAKTLHKADYSITGDRDALLFTLAIHNATGHNLLGFTGQMHFQNLFNQDLDTASLAYEHPLDAGKTAQWDGQINYNPYIDSNVTLANEPLANIHIVFDVQELIYGDGTHHTVSP